MNYLKHSIAIPIGAFGDLFVISGAINYYSYLPNIDRVYVIVIPHIPSKSALGNTTKNLFKDNKNVEVIVTSNINRYPTENFISSVNEIINRPGHFIQYPLELGYLSQHNNANVLWDEQIYTMLDLPFSIRYRSFTLPIDLHESKSLHEKLVKKEEYILTHKEIGTMVEKLPIDIYSWRKDYGLDPIDNYQVIDIDSSLSDNMIDYVYLIKNAKEIHCTPSSFHCLVDSITSLTNAKLFLHMIRKNFHMRINNNYNNGRWNLIHYHEDFMK